MSGPSTTDDTLAELLDGLDGVMQLLQLLVLELARQQSLDDAAYARTIAAWRNDHVEPGSMADVLCQRMLGPLVDQPEVLLRRSGMRLVAADTRDDAPTGPASDREPEADA